jgi:DNA-binding IscR family transcriptional regulator
MLKLNRKTEYALMAIQYMCHREVEPGEVANTREISEAYHIPYPLLAKVMQRLAAKGVIKSIHGTKGGYQLAKRPENIVCSIKDPLSELNNKIYSLLSHTSIKDLIAEDDSGKLWKTQDKEELPVYDNSRRSVR